MVGESIEDEGHKPAGGQAGDVIEEAYKRDARTWGFRLNNTSDLCVCASGGRDSSERKSVLEFYVGYSTKRTRMLVVNLVYWALDGAVVPEKKLPVKQRRKNGQVTLW